MGMDCASFILYFAIIIFNCPRDLFFIQDDDILVQAETAPLDYEC